MDYTIIILFIIALLLGICWIARDQRKIKEQEQQLAQYQECDDIQKELEKAQAAYDEAQANLLRAREDYATVSAQVASAKEEVDRYNYESQHVQKLITINRDRIDNDIAELRKAKVEQLQRDLATMESTNAQKIQTAQQRAEAEVARYTAELEAAKGKYFSVLEVLRQNEDDEETHKLHIPETARTDIEYLLNAVALRLNNPNIIYKLIWSEYIQAPANELLNNILPAKDCSGIYKITDCENKKCYIGRSTSVRKRLQEHIKSAIGIENIASQRVHEVMRDKGLWNFRFELLEECPKDQLGEREKYYIDFFDSQTYGYNQVSGSAYKDKGD